MIIFLTLIYCVFAVVTTLAGLLISYLEYSFYGGHKDKKLLWRHIAYSILIGVLWPISLVVLCFMTLCSIILDWRAS
jgi:hypothetical protein